MKNTVAILFLLSFCYHSSVLSQNTQNGLISKPIDTTYSKDFDAYYFDLKPVDSSAFKYHVRIPVISMIYN